MHPHTLLSIACAVASAGISGGCTSGDEPGDARNSPTDFSVEDSSGVVIVTNRGDGWGSEAAWRLEADLQVGELDGPLAFGRINWVGPGPDGGMLVLDGQSHRVHVFDSAASEVARFGGEGEGPGEFRRPAMVTRLSDGRYAVSQGFPPVLHWLDADGEYVESIGLPTPRDEAGTRTVGAFGLWQVTTPGRVFVQVQVIDPGAADGEMPVILLEIDPTGRAMPDTITSWTWHAGIGDQKIRVFEPVHTWMPRADGVVVVSAGAPYEIRWHDPSSGLLRLTRRNVSAVRVTDRHRERAIANMREGMDEGGAPDDRIDALLDKAEFGSTLPDVLRLWVSEPDGRLWVGVHEPGLLEVVDDGPLYGLMNALDIFERDGRYLGRIPMPDGFRLRVVTENALYGVWEDELEVPFARRYRVVRPGQN